MFKRTQVQLLVPICLVAALLACSKAKEAGESCHLRELDLCAVGATSFFSSPNGVALSEKDMKRQCEILGESIKCHDDFTERCMVSGHADLGSMFLGGIHDMERDFCRDKTSELYLDYKKHGACFQSVQKKHQRRCIIDLQAGLEPIHKMAHRERLVLGCCSLRRFRECILSKVLESCGQEAGKLVETWLRRMIGNQVNVLCRNYDPAKPDCLSVLPAQGTVPFNGRNTSAISRIVSGYAGIGQQR